MLQDGEERRLSHEKGARLQRCPLRRPRRARRLQPRRRRLVVKGKGRRRHRQQRQQPAPKQAPRHRC
eukprot:774536-Prorocentrum_minimum.AAC.1